MIYRFLQADERIHGQVPEPYDVDKIFRPGFGHPTHPVVTADIIRLDFGAQFTGDSSRELKLTINYLYL